MSEQWPSSPVLAHEREEAVFDLVPQARSRREMGHGNGQSGFVRQFLQFIWLRTHGKRGESSSRTEPCSASPSGMIVLAR